MGLKVFILDLSLPHSFIQAISIAPLSSPLLLRGAPNTARILCRIFMLTRHRELRVKALPKVPMWQLERDSNPQPFGRKAMNLPVSHHAPKIDLLNNVILTKVINSCSGLFATRLQQLWEMLCISGVGSLYTVTKLQPINILFYMLVIPDRSKQTLNAKNLKVQQLL